MAELPTLVDGLDQVLVDPQPKFTAPLKRSIFHLFMLLQNNYGQSLFNPSIALYNVCTTKPEKDNLRRLLLWLAWELKDQFAWDNRKVGNEGFDGREVPCPIPPSLSSNPTLTAEPVNSPSPGPLDTPA